MLPGQLRRKGSLHNKSAPKSNHQRYRSWNPNKTNTQNTGNSKENTSDSKRYQIPIIENGRGHNCLPDILLRHRSRDNGLFRTHEVGTRIKARGDGSKRLAARGRASRLVWSGGGRRHQWPAQGPAPSPCAKPRGHRWNRVRIMWWKSRSHSGIPTRARGEGGLRNADLKIWTMLR